MTRCFVLLLAALLPLAGRAQSTPPAGGQVVSPASDSARQALDAWLDAFNANDRARLEAFRDRYLPTFDVNGMLRFHGQTGGFPLIRREPAAPGSAQALVQEAASETAVRVSVALREGKLLLPAMLADATRGQTPWYGYGFMVDSARAWPASGPRWRGRRHERRVGGLSGAG